MPVNGLLGLIYRGGLNDGEKLGKCRRLGELVKETVLGIIYTDDSSYFLLQKSVCWST